MHIRILEQFVSSLRGPLRSVGASADVDSLIAALAPYAEWKVADFTAFLEAADAFRRNGQVAIPRPEDGPVKRLLESVASIRAAVAAGNAAAAESAQRAAAAAMTEAGAPLGLTVKPTIDKKWLAAQKSAAREAELSTRLRALAARIASPDSYASPDLQPEIEFFDTLEAADWKLLAKAVPGKLPPKKKAVAALAQLTGHAAPAPAKKSAKNPAFTHEQLLPYAQRLRDRIERSNDRDIFPRSEVDAQIAELQSLDAAMIKAILKEANFSFSGAATKPNMLKKLHEFLDAGHRALDKVQA